MAIKPFRGERAFNDRLPLRSHTETKKLGEKKGYLVKLLAGKKDLQHWVFPGGHPSKY